MSGSKGYHEKLSSLIDYPTAAQLLCIPVPTLRRWVSEGRCPHVRLSPRTVRFNLAALNAWVAAHAVQPQCTGAESAA